MHGHADQKPLKQRIFCLNCGVTGFDFVPFGQSAGGATLPGWCRDKNECVEAKRAFHDLVENIDKTLPKQRLM